MASYILALDQGTTSSRAILFDQQQNIIGISQKEFTQHYPREGWVEHDPMEIYSSQYAVMMEVITQSGVEVSDIKGIGITNQRETTILWDKKTGRPVYNAIVWQCRRTADLVDELKKKGLGEYIREATGLVPDAYFSATKIAWILDHIPEGRERARRGEILFGTVDSWLIWKLTGGKAHVTDYTNASRTMLYNIHTLDWDDKLLEALDIPRCMLPQVMDSSAIYGYTTIQGESVPIAGIAGDQQAALFGQCCFHAGQAKNTYGTGCFLLMHTGHEACASEHGLVTTVAASAPNAGDTEYALEGSVFMAGALIQWLRDELGIIDSVAETDAIARSVATTDGVFVVPAFTGLGAPWWDADARGAILGLTRGAGRAHIVRAALESIAYQVCDLARAMAEDARMPLSVLNVDGGAAANDFLMQFQADMLGAPLRRPDNAETTALGAAYLAGLSTGFWKSTEELAALREGEDRFLPTFDEPMRAARLAARHEAVSRVRS